MDTVDEVRIPPAGAPFSASFAGEGFTGHACNSGWVTIGQVAYDEDGEETIEQALYLCRRCAKRGCHDLL
jgi:hypothetical protein